MAQESHPPRPRPGHEHGRLQSAAVALAAPVFHCLWRIEVTGTENLPRSGPAILAANHNSVIDSFLLPVVLPRRISFVGKAEYLHDWKTRSLFPALGMIPIDRGGGDAARHALDVAAEVLERGELFGIYPEGTRSRTGFLHRGHTGAARLAMRTGAPIIPVGLLGTRAVQPPDTPLPRPFRPVEIRFGRPISSAAGDSIPDSGMRLRQITDEVMYEIRALTGQHYVDNYAAKGASSPLKKNEFDAGAPARRSSAEVLRAHDPLP